MKQKVSKLLSESKTARWVALALISLTMFFAYFFVDVVAPLQSMLERSPYLWSPEVFGMLGGSEFFLNVFAFFLILSGIILDKMGIRFTLITAGLTMVIGGSLKYYALTDGFSDTGFALWLNSFFVGVPASAKLAFVGFSIFGVGVEMAGITVSKTIVKWFKGKEMALAMGLEMATARLGVFAVFRLTPIFAEQGGVANSVFWGVAFLCIGFLTFLIYTFMDAKLDKQRQDSKDQVPEEEFKISDIGKIFSNPGFLAIAGLCVLFYSAIFPFQKFATDMLASKLNLDIRTAAAYFSYFPIGAMVLTPFIGYYLDVKGKGATMMLYGAILLTVSHLIFALVPSESFTVFTAILTIVILGTAFSLVPASMWPSVPKIVEERYLGSAYGSIFWIQNIGLLAVPILIGWSITVSNPGIGEKTKQIGIYTNSIDSINNTLNASYTSFNDQVISKTDQVLSKNVSQDFKNYVFINKFLVESNLVINNSVDSLTGRFAQENYRNKILENLNKSLEIGISLSSDTTFSKYDLTQVNSTYIKIQDNVKKIQSIKGDVKYSYTVPELIFACFGVLAMILAVVLKIVDRKKGYGLDLPNKK